MKTDSFAKVPLVLGRNDSLNPDPGAEERGCGVKLVVPLPTVRGHTSAKQCWKTGKVASQWRGPSCRCPSEVKCFLLEVGERLTDSGVETWDPKKLTGGPES